MTSSLSSSPSADKNDVPFFDNDENVQSYVKDSKGYDGLKLIDKMLQYLSNDDQQNSIKVLELGSGPGTDYQLLRQKKHRINGKEEKEISFDVVGSDYSTGFLKHLKTSIPDGTFLRLDAGQSFLRQHQEQQQDEEVTDDKKLLQLDTSDESSLYSIIYSNKVLMYIDVLKSYLG